jgi:hypothetical protein
MRSIAICLCCISIGVQASEWKEIKSNSVESYWIDFSSVQISKEHEEVMVWVRTTPNAENIDVPQWKPQQYSRLRMFCDRGGYSIVAHTMDRVDGGLMPLDWSKDMGQLPAHADQVTSNIYKLLCDALEELPAN